MYPSLVVRCNIEHGTKIATVIEIEGEDQEGVLEFFRNVTDPASNSVTLGERFLNLPGFEELGKTAVSEGLI